MVPTIIPAVKNAKLRSQCMEAAFSLFPAARRSRTGSGLTVNFDLAQLDISAGTVAAAGHQVRKADLVDLTQVWIGYPDFIIWIRCGWSHVDRDDAIRIQFDPPDVRQGEFAKGQFRDRRKGEVSHQQRAVREFHYRPHDMETRRLGEPPYVGETG